MVAGGGGRALKVRILGDASDAVRAAKQTQIAFKGLDDQIGSTGKLFDGLGSKVTGSVSIIGKGLAATTAAFTAASAGWGLAGTAAIGGIAAAALGASAAVAGLGIVFAAQNEVVKNEWALVIGNIQKGMQQASRSFEPVLLNLMHKLNETFMTLKPGITFLLDVMAPVVEKIGRNLIDGFVALTPLFVDLVKMGTPFVSMLGDQIVPLFEKIATFTPSTFLVQLIRDMTPVFQQLAPVVKSLIGMFGLLGGPVAGALKEALPALSGFLTALADNLGPLLATITEQLGTVLSSALSALTPLLPVIADTLTQVVETLGPTLAEMFTTLGPPITELVTALAPLLPQLAELGSVILVGLANTLTPVVQALAPLITQFVEQLKPIIDEMTPKLQEFGEKFGEEIANNIIELTPGILELTNALLPLVPPIVDLLTQVLLFEQQSKGSLIQFFEDGAYWAGQLTNKLNDLQNNGAWKFLTDNFGGVAGAAGVADPDNWMRMFGGVFGAVGSFGTGGIVPGPKGQPGVALVHGGETILPTHEMGLQAALNEVIHEDDPRWDWRTMGNRTNGLGEDGAARFAADEKAGAEFAALGWPAEDVRAIADLIARGGAPAANGGAPVIVNVAVAGSVQTERDLVQAVRSGFIQANRIGTGSTA